MIVDENLPRRIERFVVSLQAVCNNLGLSARELFTPFIATHVSIRTSDTSSIPHRTPSQAYRTLSYHAHTRLITLLNRSLSTRL